ncbi:restriction endonuclease [Kribbella sp. CWNU-51]
MTDSQFLEDEGAAPSSPVGSISFDNLDPTDFEEFCFDLLGELGFVNVDWRKGTDKKASPADRGRDLVAQLERNDVDGHTYLETWFVDCKHYKRGVPPEALQGLLTWAEAEKPAVVLVIASGYLSNPAKDWLSQYTRNRRPPFRIRHWEKPQLKRMLIDNPELMASHGIIPEHMRTTAEILAAEEEFFDKVWYVRKLILEERVEEGRREPLQPEIEQAMRDAMLRVEDRRGRENLGPWGDWEWGFVNGKLSALRWVLGEEWDFLDT